MKREANIQWVDKKGNSILLMVADRLRRKIYVTEETFIELFNIFCFEVTKILKKLLKTVSITLYSRFTSSVSFLFHDEFIH